MAFLDGLISSGRLFDLIIVLVALEAVALALLPRFAPALSGRLPALSVIWPTLLSGALLMLAVRLAVTDAPSIALAGVLALSLVSHLADVALRARPGAERSLRAERL